MNAEINGTIGHYPTDATEYVQELITAFETKPMDMQLLAHGAYGLVGFALNLFIGEPKTAAMTSTAMVGALGNLLLVIEAAAGVPVWLKPILGQAVNLLLVWLQSKLAPTA